MSTNAEKEQFVMQNRAELIQKVPTVMAIVDSLGDIVHPEIYAAIQAEKSNMDRMRKLYTDVLQLGGPVVKAAFYNALKQHQPHLLEMIGALRIVLIGKTGVGKSASGNTILGEKRFFSQPSTSGVTLTCKEQSTMWNNRMISVVDTPGHLDTHKSVGDVTREIMRCIQFSRPGPHVFLHVIQVGRFTKEDLGTLQALQKLFGPEADKYMIVLFTHGNELEDTTTQQYVRGASPAVRLLIQQCGGRFHVFNNRCTDRRQVDELIKMIDHMVAANRGSYYTC